MRIAIISDIHHGAASHTKCGAAALDLLAGFSEWCNKIQPDVVLDLGDRISDVDTATDLQLEQDVANALAGIDAPIHHICGNHDRDHLSVAQNEEILGQSLGHELVDCGDWQIALWRAEAKITRNADYRGFSLPEPDFLWLSNAICTATKPTLVACHVPVSGHSQTGNYYFQRNPQFSTYPQAGRVRAALEQAQVPLAVLSGHVHWNGLCQINGIWHLTQQSLTESFTTAGQPCGAWGLIETRDQDLHWQVFGKDPFEARLRVTADRWTPPMEPFE